MVDLSSAVLTTLIGMLGIVVGAIISNYVNQKMAVRTTRRDIIFKKKAEYFEKTVECIEKNAKLYKNSIREAERNSDKQAVNKIIKKLKEERMKFDVMTSRLYIESNFLSNKIKKFTSIEKSIFILFEKLKNENREEETMQSLKESLKILGFVGSEIISGMRNNLMRS